MFNVSFNDLLASVFDVRVCVCVCVCVINGRSILLIQPVLIRTKPHMTHLVLIVQIIGEAVHSLSVFTAPTCDRLDH